MSQDNPLPQPPDGYGSWLDLLTDQEGDIEWQVAELRERLKK